MLKAGVRELDLVQQYTVHPFDQVLGVYFAQARMYDAADRRFMAMDTLKGQIANSQTIVQYTYCLNNPLVYIDSFGLNDNPIDILKGLIKDPSSLGKLSYKGTDYYSVRDVFKKLNGGTTLWDEIPNNTGSSMVDFIREGKGVCNPAKVDEVFNL